LISAIFLFPAKKEVNQMLINAKVFRCMSREIETTRGKKDLTELYLLDVDTKNFYVGQILGDRGYSYKESEIVTFQVGVITRKKKIYLTITPEEAERASNPPLPHFTQPATVTEA